MHVIYRNSSATHLPRFIVVALNGQHDLVQHPINTVSNQLQPFQWV